MRKIDLTLALCFSLVFSGPVAAATGGLLSQAVEQVTPSGMLWLSSYKDLKDSLRTARTLNTRGGAPVLRLTDAAYANIVWKNVTLVFDRDQSLAKIELTTNAESYEALKQRLSAGADPIWSLSGNSSLSSDAPDDAIMICEHDDGSVSLTFNRTPAPVSRTMIARADPMPSALTYMGE